MPEGERRYHIEFNRKATKALRNLPRDLWQRLMAAINALATNPRPPGCVKLAGFENAYRIRVGQWRVVYLIDDDRLVITIIAIGPRGSVYDDL